jgi:hypothetical protein
LRKQIHVTYELNLITGDGREVKEEFSYQFDYEIYNEDRDGTDFLTINFLMQNMKKKHGDDVLLVEFSVTRGNGYVN